MPKYSAGPRGAPRAATTKDSLSLQGKKSSSSTTTGMRAGVSTTTHATAGVAA